MIPQNASLAKKLDSQEQAIRTISVANSSYTAHNFIFSGLSVNESVSIYLQTRYAIGIIMVAVSSTGVPSATATVLYGAASNFAVSNLTNGFKLTHGAWSSLTGFLFCTWSKTCTLTITGTS